MCCIDYVCLQNELDNRIHSYTNWNGVICPLELAKAGFYFINFKDAVRCFKCKIEIFNWKEHDVPIDEHLKFSPNCEFAKNIKSHLLWEHSKFMNKKIIKKKSFSDILLIINTIAMIFLILIITPTYIL